MNKSSALVDIFLLHQQINLSCGTPLYVILTFNFDRQRLEAEGKDPVAARKVQKADREKLRRDRLNEQFQELGNALGNMYVMHSFAYWLAFPNIIFMVTASMLKKLIVSVG